MLPCKKRDGEGGNSAVRGESSCVPYSRVLLFAWSICYAPKPRPVSGYTLFCFASFSTLADKVINERFSVGVEKTLFIAGFYITHTFHLQLASQ